MTTENKQHSIVFLSYNSIAKTCWFELDGVRRVLTNVERLEDCDKAISDFVEWLDSQEEPVIVHRYSKLKLCMALNSLGKLGDFQTWIVNSGYEFLWNAAQDLADDNELFNAGIQAVKTALDLTDEQVSEILANSVEE